MLNNPHHAVPETTVTPVICLLTTEIIPPVKSSSLQHLRQNGHSCHLSLQHNLYTLQSGTARRDMHLRCIWLLHAPVDPLKPDSLPGPVVSRNAHYVAGKGQTHRNQNPITDDWPLQPPVSHSVRWSLSSDCTILPMHSSLISFAPILFFFFFLQINTNRLPLISTARTEGTFCI